MNKFDKKNLVYLGIVLLAIILIVFIYPKKNTNTIKTNKGEVKIKKLESSTIELEEYNSDVLTMKKPKGWKVETGGTGVYYAIKVTDPNDTRNQIFLMPKIQPLLKSNKAKEFWKNYYNLSGKDSKYRVYTEAVVLDSPTTEGFYKKFNDVGSYIKKVDSGYSNITFPTFNDFKKIDEQESTSSMKSVSINSKVLRATFTNEDSKESEGMFLASIVNFGNQYQDGVDFSYYMIYDIMTITSAKDKFIEYKDILLKSINSIEFSDSYVKKAIDDGNTQTKQALALSASIQKAFDSYMSAWENRNKTYDIMSQKQSDATLGYERVYNTDTNEIYKAYNGFTDDYKGNQYKSITDEMYADKVSGYIEK